MADTAAPVEAPETPAAPPEAVEGSVPQPKADAKPAEPAKPAPRTFKAKVNGRDIELPEDEVIQSGLSAAQIRRAANEQFEAAHKARAEVEAFKNGLQTQGAKFLMQQMGPEAFRNMVIQAATEEMKREQMDPQQRALLEERQRREQLEEQIRAQQQQQVQAREAQIVASLQQQYDQEFGKALADYHLPKTTETVRRMAGIMKAYNQRNVTLSPAEAAQMVREDIASESVGTLGQMDGARLIEMLGPEVMKKIRAADIARVKGAKPQNGTPPPESKAPPASKQNRGPNSHLLSPEEWYVAMGADPKSPW